MHSVLLVILLAIKRKSGS